MTQDLTIPIVEVERSNSLKYWMNGVRVDETKRVVESLSGSYDLSGRRVYIILPAVTREDDLPETLKENSYVDYPGLSNYRVKSYKLKSHLDTEYPGLLYTPFSAIGKDTEKVHRVELSRVIEDHYYTANLYGQTDSAVICFPTALKGIVTGSGSWKDLSLRYLDLINSVELESLTMSEDYVSTFIEFLKSSTHG